ncbi:CLUMA_CG008015, isoform A [Clunio marinus]|uniref:CLUMA_CG008015, isoform A n=1 Tax=Clunio marinus TaxID=568069 RepID=A0A1J1I6E4_9DIPT|nr:CLUMA_CG008015, isoform A [Clunio marinus]
MPSSGTIKSLLKLYDRNHSQEIALNEAILCCHVQEMHREILYFMSFKDINETVFQIINALLLKDDFSSLYFQFIPTYDASCISEKSKSEIHFIAKMFCKHKSSLRTTAIMPIAIFSYTKKPHQ